MPPNLKEHARLLLLGNVQHHAIMLSSERYPVENNVLIGDREIQRVGNDLTLAVDNPGYERMIPSVYKSDAEGQQQLHSMVDVASPGATAL